MLAEDRAILKAIGAVDRMFNEEERLVYETRMQSLADVESKIASAEQKGEARGMAESLRIILKGKYGALPERVNDQIHNANSEQLRYWMQHAFTAESLDELLSPT